MGATRRTISRVREWLGPAPYVPVFWDVAALVAGVSSMLGFWAFGVPLLALAAAASWRLLALADWSPASAVDQDQRAGGAIRSRYRGSGVSVLWCGTPLTFGVLDRLLPSMTGFLAGAAIATLVFRPRWPVLALRWLMPLAGGAAVVGLQSYDVGWRAFAFFGVAVLLTLDWLRPRFRPRLPSFRRWLGLREGASDGQGEASSS